MREMQKGRGRVGSVLYLALGPKVRGDDLDDVLNSAF